MSFPFDTLPLLVKQNIIGYAADAAARPSGWLALQAVSHSFQELSFPYIYRTVIYRGIAQHAYQTLDNTFCIANSLKIPRLPVPSVYLARYAKTTRHARTLVVDLGLPVNFFKSIMELIQSLAFNANVWSGVRSIYFFDLKTSMSQRDAAIQINARYPSSTRNDILVRLADMFFNHMPNVVNLTFCLHDSLGRGHLLGKWLMDKYSSKLRVFRPMATIYFSPLQIDYNITHLHIVYNPTVPHFLSRMRPEIMVSLFITQLVPSFSWSWFSRRQNKDLCFSSLVHLELSFKQINAARLSHLEGNSDTLSGQTFKVLFPKLQALVVKDQKTQALNMFNSVHLPDTLRTIVFLNSLHTLYQLKNKINLGMLSGVYISVNYTVSWDMFIKTTNHYFGRAILYSQSWLDISMLRINLLPSLIDWTTLDTLNLYEIHVLALTDLIPKLPLLRCLNIKIVTFWQIIQEGRLFDWMGFMNATSSTALSAKLENLIIYCTLSPLTQETTAFCLRYLVRRLPFLKNFRAPQYNITNQVHIP